MQCGRAQRGPRPAHAETHAYFRYLTRQREYVSDPHWILGITKLAGQICDLSPATFRASIMSHGSRLGRVHVIKNVPVGRKRNKERDGTGALLFARLFHRPRKNTRSQPVVGVEAAAFFSTANPVRLPALSFPISIKCMCI